MSGGGKRVIVSAVRQFSYLIAVAAENCTDGVQNQNETGVDCGGVCSACGKTKTFCSHFKKSSYQWQVEMKSRQGIIVFLSEF